MSVISFFAGISQVQYFAALRGGEELKFVCEPCVLRIPPRDNDGIAVCSYMYIIYPKCKSAQAQNHEFKI